MPNRKISQSLPAPEPGLASVSRGILVTANGEGRLRNTPPSIEDVLGISEMLDHQPTDDNGHSHGPKHSDDAHQSAYEAGLTSGREVGYRQGYRAGFLAGYKLKNPVPATAATPDKTTVESNKTVGKSVTRLRGLPCAHCGRTTYSDELECPSCGTPKAHPAVERLAKGSSPAAPAAR